MGKRFDLGLEGFTRLDKRPESKLGRAVREVSEEFPGVEVKWSCRASYLYLTLKIETEVPQYVAERDGLKRSIREAIQRSLSMEDYEDERD